MQYCENCNESYPDAAQFCPACGKKLVFRPERVNRQKVLGILKSLPGYKKILRDCTIFNYDEKVHFDYIVVHEAGIFAFQFYESYRIVEGSDKMRYWTAEDYNRGGAVVKIERPVAALERDHVLLDQVLRRYTFTKSFAFLILPQDAGLEKVRSVHLDQMLTVPRMAGILIRSINDYGHAYDKADVDKVYDILSDLIKKQILPAQEAAPKQCKARSLSRLGRIISVMFLLAGILLACVFILSKERQTAAFVPRASQAVVTPSPSQIPDTVSAILIPSGYASLFDAYAQSGLDQTAAAIGCHSIRRQSDGALQIALYPDSVNSVLDTAASAFQEKTDLLFKARALPDFTSLRLEDHSRFTVFVTSQDQNSNESLIIAEMFRLAVLYAALEGNSTDSFSIVFRGQDGQQLSAITLNSFLSKQ